VSHRPNESKYSQFHDSNCALLICGKLLGPLPWIWMARAKLNFLSSLGTTADVTMASKHTTTRQTCVALSCRCYGNWDHGVGAAVFFDCWQHYTVSKKKINPTCFIIKWLNINRFKQYLQEVILNKKYVTVLWNTAKFCDFLSLVNWNRLSVSNRLWVIYEFEGFVPDQKWRQVNLPLEVAYCRKWKRIKKAY